MRADGTVNVLNKCTLGVTVILIVMGARVLLNEPVTAWFAFTSGAAMVLLVLASLWHLRGSVVALAAVALTGIVVSRLFSILRLAPPASIAGMSPQDLDLQVATGPGVAGFQAIGWLFAALVLAQFIREAVLGARASDSARSSVSNWALMFIRVYVGIMFVPHFGSHLLGGPYQFSIYKLYFSSLGLHAPAAQVALAGSVELVTAICLTLGLLTRPAALLGAVYLLLSMLWGGHFQIGYVWALPEGGYEFGLFWAAMIAVFMLIGGGPLSLDATMKNKRLLWARSSRVAALL